MFKITIMKNLLLSIFSMFVMAEVALAQTNYPLSSTASFGGGAPLTVGVQNGDTISSSLIANESYCCSVFPAAAGVNIGFSPTIVDPSSNNISGVLRGNVMPAIYVDPDTDVAGSADNRICLLAASTGLHKFSFIALTGTQQVVASCERTSANVGFNTNGTPFNFMECTNRTSTERSVRFFARDSSGNVLVDGNASAGQFTVSAGVRRDKDIHSLVGASKFGDLSILHDGPPGSVSCGLSRYSSDLTLRGSEEALRF